MATAPAEAGGSRSLLHLRSRAKVVARSALHRAGFDLVRSLGSDDLLRRRMDLLHRHGINVLFDVGANVGQYASTMRSLGYDGRIVSFEPSSEAFHILEQTSRHDASWTALRCALDEQSGKATLNVSGNSQSSSFLPMLPTHVVADPASAFVGEEPVDVTTLAEQIDRYVQPDDRLFVKIDTQGSELRVLAGASGKLARVAGIQVELSLVPLYEGQPLIEEVTAALRAEGYVPMSIEPDFVDRNTGALLQADGIFFPSPPLQPHTAAVTH